MERGSGCIIECRAMSKALLARVSTSPVATTYVPHTKRDRAKLLRESGGLVERGA